MGRMNDVDNCQAITFLFKVECASVDWQQVSPKETASASVAPLHCFIQGVVFMVTGYSELYEC